MLPSPKRCPQEVGGGGGLLLMNVSDNNTVMALRGLGFEGDWSSHSWNTSMDVRVRTVWKGRE